MHACWFESKFQCFLLRWKTQGMSEQGAIQCWSKKLIKGGGGKLPVHAHVRVCMQFIHCTELPHYHSVITRVILPNLTEVSEPDEYGSSQMVNQRARDYSEASLTIMKRRFTPSPLLIIHLLYLHCFILTVWSMKLQKQCNWLKHQASSELSELSLLGFSSEPFTVRTSIGLHFFERDYILRNMKGKGQNEALTRIF